jgi:hypothetical protein
MGMDFYVGDGTKHMNIMWAKYKTHEYNVSKVQNP